MAFERFLTRTAGFFHLLSTGETASWKSIKLAILEAPEAAERSLDWICATGSSYLHYKHKGSRREQQAFCSFDVIATNSNLSEVDIESLEVLRNMISNPPKISQVLRKMIVFSAQTTWTTSKRETVRKHALKLKLVLTALFPVNECKRHVNAM